MRAARIIAPGRAGLEDVAVPEPGPGQVRVAVEACGVCGSNIPVWEGREWFTYPFAPGSPGHEGCGVIDAVGAGVSGLRVGQRVAALSFSAFAEYDLAEATSVVPIPAGVSEPYVLGEPLGCAVNVARRCGFGRGQTVVIVGVGFLGALVLQLAREAIGSEGRLIAVSRREDALEVARGCGADEAIPLRGFEETKRAVERVTGGKPCDVAVEAAGLQEPLDLAGELVRERGRLVIAGYHQDGKRTVNMQSWNWRGIDVINAHERDPAVFTEGMRLAVHAVAAGRLNVGRLMTHRYPLERVGEAFEAARTRPPGFLKAVVVMRGGAS
jgi:threonine dehydrogenase-like Zn-dependent dehydrogenase